MTKKEEEQAKACCYCTLCIAIIVLIIAAIVLIFIYWYISLPIIVGVILFSYIYQQKQKQRLAKLLDTIPNQQEFKAGTGLNAIEDGELTNEYKAWLLRKADVSTLTLFTNPQYRPMHTLQPQPYQQQPEGVQTNLEQEKNFCTKCGTSNKQDSDYCNNCGNKLD